MKIRNPKENERKIKMIYPKFFFHYCKVCKLEFKQTLMWKWVDYWEWEGDKHWAYACTSCVPNLEDLYQHIHSFKAAEIEN